MATAAWPIHLLRPRNVTAHLAPRSIAGTVSTSGFTQRVSAGANSWVITYEGILVATEEQRLSWNAYEAYLEGGTVPVLVNVLGDLTAGPPAPPDGVISGDQPQGVTLLNISRAIRPVQAGMDFTIGERLYRVIYVVLIGADLYQCNILPPLRDPILNGWLALFSQPVCKCRLATDDEMALKLEPGRIGTGNVRFVEDPSPPEA